MSNDDHMAGKGERGALSWLVFLVAAIVATVILVVWAMSGLGLRPKKVDLTTLHPPELPSSPHPAPLPSPVPKVAG